MHNVIKKPFKHIVLPKMHVKDEIFVQIVKKFSLKTSCFNLNIGWFIVDMLVNNILSNKYNHLIKIFGQMCLLWENLNNHLYQFQTYIPPLKFHHHLHVFNKLDMNLIIVFL